jgi:hypothetical protein
MTDSATAIVAAPILDALQPLVTAAVSAAVAGVVGIAVAAYNSWKYRASSIDAAHEKAIADAASNEAAKIVAGAVTAEFGNLKIDLNSPAINAAAANIIGADAANLKAALVATGATPGRVASLVLGAVGAAQIKIVGGSAGAVTPAP